jgi:hypothetical protein
MANSSLLRCGVAEIDRPARPTVIQADPSGLLGRDTPESSRKLLSLFSLLSAPTYETTI